MGNRDERKYAEGNGKNDNVRKCCDAGRGNIEVGRFFMRSCTGTCVVTSSIQGTINDLVLLLIVEAAKQGVTVGDNTVSGLMFADVFVGISLTLELEKTLEYTTGWRVTANVEKRAVVACNERKMNPVSYSWKWGEDEFPIVNQCTCLGVEIPKTLLGKTNRKG